MYKFSKGEWDKVTEGSSKAGVCWNCNNKVASEKYYCSYFAGSPISYIYICPHCNAPIIIDGESKKILLPLPGTEIKNLPKDIEMIYFEIRRCVQSGCSNGAIMLMRKLIMHVAVEEGTVEGKSFVKYVDYLYDNEIVTKKRKKKVDSVRTIGNSANHEIEGRTLEEAQNSFEFIELLLKVNYEFADKELEEEVVGNQS